MSDLLFFCWHDVRLAPLIPMVWATGAHEMAGMVATSVASNLRLHRPGQRVLLIVPALEGIWKGDMVRLIGVGPDISLHARWFAVFFQELERRGAKPDFIALDEEFAFNTFNLMDRAKDPQERVAIARRFFEDPAVHAKMPDEVKALKPESFGEPNFYVPGAVPETTWNNWAAKATGRVIEKAVFDPAKSVWPKFTQYGNYDASVLGQPTVDYNGWAVPTIDLGGASCPSLYLITGLAHRGRKKHELWNTLIGSINLARGAIISGRPVMPWVSFPSMTQSKPPTEPQTMRWLWAALMEHLIAAGLTRFLYFNPMEQGAMKDNAFVVDFIRSHTKVATVAKPTELTTIEWDADQITTGSATVTYEQFEKIVPGVPK